MVITLNTDQTFWIDGREVPAIFYMIPTANGLFNLVNAEDASQVLAEDVSPKDVTLRAGTGYTMTAGQIAWGALTTSQKTFNTLSQTIGESLYKPETQYKQVAGNLHIDTAKGLALDNSNPKKVYINAGTGISFNSSTGQIQASGLTNAQVKSKYEANSNTNAFTDLERNKLSKQDVLALDTASKWNIHTRRIESTDTGAITDPNIDAFIRYRRDNNTADGARLCKIRYKKGSVEGNIIKCIFTVVGYHHPTDASYTTDSRQLEYIIDFRKENTRFKRVENYDDNNDRGFVSPQLEFFVKDTKPDGTVSSTPSDNTNREILIATDTRDTFTLQIIGTGKQGSLYETNKTNFEFLIGAYNNPEQASEGYNKGTIHRDPHNFGERTTLPTLNLVTGDEVYHTVGGECIHKTYKDGSWQLAGNPVAVIDNLNATDTDKALSAAQGKVLKGLIDAIVPSKFRGKYNSDSSLPASGNSYGSYAIVDTGSAADAQLYVWDNDSSKWVQAGSAVVIVNNLTSTATTSALSAAMGKKLNDDKQNKADKYTDGTFLASGNTNEQNKFVTAKAIQASTLLSEAEVHNDLTSTETNEPLAANQGKVLKDTFDAFFNGVKKDGVTKLKTSDLIPKQYVQEGDGDLHIVSTTNGGSRKTYLAVQDNKIVKELINDNVAGNGLLRNTTTKAIDVNPGDGIELASDKVKAKINTDTLEFDNGAIKVKKEVTKTPPNNLMAIGNLAAFTKIGNRHLTISADGSDYVAGSSTTKKLKGFIGLQGTVPAGVWYVELNPHYVDLAHFIKKDPTQTTTGSDGEVFSKIHFFLSIYRDASPKPLPKTGITTSRFAPVLHRKGEDDSYNIPGTWTELGNGFYYFQDYTDNRGMFQSPIEFNDSESFRISQNGGWIDVSTAAKRAEAKELARTELGLTDVKESEDSLNKPAIGNLINVKMLGPSTTPIAKNTIKELKFYSLKRVETVDGVAYNFHAFQIGGGGSQIHSSDLVQGGSFDINTSYYRNFHLHNNTVFYAVRKKSDKKWYLGTAYLGDNTSTNKLKAIVQGDGDLRITSNIGFTVDRMLFFHPGSNVIGAAWQFFNTAQIDYKHSIFFPSANWFPTGKDYNSDFLYGSAEPTPAGFFSDALKQGTNSLTCGIGPNQGSSRKVNIKVHTEYRSKDATQRNAGDYQYDQYNRKGGSGADRNTLEKNARFNGAININYPNNWYLGFEWRPTSTVVRMGLIPLQDLLPFTVKTVTIYNAQQQFDVEVSLDRKTLTFSNIGSNIDADAFQSLYLIEILDTGDVAAPSQLGLNTTVNELYATQTQIWLSKRPLNRNTLFSTFGTDLSPAIYFDKIGNVGSGGSSKRMGLLENEVLAVNIKDGAVTGAKIAADAIDSSKLADDSVGKEHIKADVAGAGLVQNASDGSLDVNPGDGIEINSDKVKVKIDTGSMEFTSAGNLKAKGVGPQNDYKILSPNALPSITNNAYKKAIHTTENAFVLDDDSKTYAFKAKYRKSVNNLAANTNEAITSAEKTAIGSSGYVLLRIQSSSNVFEEWRVYKIDDFTSSTAFEISGNNYQHKITGKTVDEVIIFNSLTTNITKGEYFYNPTLNIKDSSWNYSSQTDVLGSGRSITTEWSWMFSRNADDSYGTRITTLNAASDPLTVGTVYKFKQNGVNYAIQNATLKETINCSAGSGTNEVAFNKELSFNKQPNTWVYFAYNNQYIVAVPLKDITPGAKYELNMAPGVNSNFHFTLNATKRSLVINQNGGYFGGLTKTSLVRLYLFEVGNATLQSNFYKQDLNLYIGFNDITSTSDITDISKALKLGGNRGIKGDPGIQGPAGPVTPDNTTIEKTAAGVVQVKNGGITTAKIGNNQVTEAKLANIKGFKNEIANGWMVTERSIGKLVQHLYSVTEQVRTISDDYLRIIEARMNFYMVGSGSNNKATSLFELISPPSTHKLISGGIIKIEMIVRGHHTRDLGIATYLYDIGNTTPNNPTIIKLRTENAHGAPLPDILKYKFHKTNNYVTKTEFILDQPTNEWRLSFKVSMLGRSGTAAQNYTVVGNFKTPTLLTRPVTDIKTPDRTPMNFGAVNSIPPNPVDGDSYTSAGATFMRVDSKWNPVPKLTSGFIKRTSSLTYSIQGLKGYRAANSIQPTVTDGGSDSKFEFRGPSGSPISNTTNLNITFATVTEHRIIIEIKSNGFDVQCVRNDGSTSEDFTSNDRVYFMIHE